MSTAQTEARMVRSRPRMLGGVCVGLAEHLRIPVRAVRIGMVVAALFGGVGIVFYLWLWILAPDADDQTRQSAASSVVGSILQRPSETKQREPGRVNPAVPVLVGCALVALAAAVAFGNVPLQILAPVFIAAAGLVLAWRQLASDDPADLGDVRWQVIGGVALVIVGVILLVLPSADGRAVGVLGGALAVLAGVGFALAPWAVRLMRALTVERAERARANERADIAAHLHDSVLQSLALIRQKSEPDSDVARIARRQERELRDWLFVREAGTAAEAPQTSDLGVQLRDVAERLDEEYGCTFDIVTIGDVAVTAASATAGDGDRTGAAPAGVDALVAAASEAMTNAARHAGGRISVLVEGSAEGAGLGSAQPVRPAGDDRAASPPDAGAALPAAGARRQLAVTVTDRGPGVDLSAIPDDRHGIRASILARMERAGGSATIMAGAGGHGTRVVLRLIEGGSR